MGFVVSYNGTSNIIRRARTDKKCDNCGDMIEVGDLYIRGILFPSEHNDFHCVKWHLDNGYCTPAYLLHLLTKMVCSSTPEQVEEMNKKADNHSQREHDINVYNFGACDDDAHDPNNR